MNNIVYAGSADGAPCQKGVIIAAATGSGKLTYKGAVYPYSGGDVIFMPPSDSVRFTPYTVTAAVISRAVVQCTGVSVFRDDGSILHAIQQAEKFTGSELPQSALVLSALGNLIIGYIQVFCADRKLSPVTRRLLAEIDERLTDCTFNTDEAIKKLPLNGDYVRKLFKKETGITPHAYLIKVRMELAQSLILGNIANRYSNYTVSQIAEACGFSEPLYFSRVYKKYFGVSPSESGKK